MIPPAVFVGCLWYSEDCRELVKDSLVAKYIIQTVGTRTQSKSPVKKPNSRHTQSRPQPKQLEAKSTATIETVANLSEDSSPTNQTGIAEVEKTCPRTPQARLEALQKEAELRGLFEELSVPSKSKVSQDHYLYSRVCVVVLQKFLTFFRNRLIQVSEGFLTV